MYCWLEIETYVGIIGAGRAEPPPARPGGGGGPLPGGTDGADLGGCGGWRFTGGGLRCGPLGEGGAFEALLQVINLQTYSQCSFFKLFRYISYPSVTYIPMLDDADPPPYVDDPPP